ncbi:MAG: LysE family translocator [Moraxella sp.]|nr:LysE family translocator [Moraxella sp.]
MLNVYLLFSYIFAIVLFLGTPGPVTAMVVNASLRGGFKAGLATVAGTNTASLMLILISFVVISGVFSINEQALTWLTFFGALYVIYFAIGILKDKAEDLQINKELEKTDAKKLSSYFSQGFFVGISNPKDILFFIAFFPTFFAISKEPIISMVILTLVWVVLDYSILSVYAKIFTKIKSATTINIINKTCGFVLLAIAIYACYHSLMKLI